MSRRLLIALAALGFIRCTVQGSVTFFENNFAGWQAASGTYSTCDFTGFAPNTFITDQYADLGVLFTNPGPNVVHLAPDLFLQDEYGIDGNCGIELTLSNPTFSIGMHGPDLWEYWLYSGSTLVYQSPVHSPSPNGFGGLVSTTAFDKVKIYPTGCLDDVYVDNVYFSSVPAPGIGILFATMSGVSGKRRRSS